MDMLPVMHRAVMDVLNEGIIVRDESGTILSCNRSAQAMLYGGRDPSGTRWNRVTHKVCDASGRPLPQEDWPTSVALRTGVPQRGVLNQLIWPDGRTLWLEVSAIPLGEGRVVSSFVDVTERQRQAEALRRRDAILHAVSRCAARLLAAADLEQVLEECLGELGDVSQGERLFLFRAEPQDRGGLFGRYVYEWCAPGVPAQIQSPELQHLDPQKVGLGSWLSELTEGRPIQCSHRLAGPAERSILDAYGLKAVCVVPMMDGDELWGVLGISTIQEERAWSPAELEALHAAASLMCTALERRRAQDARLQSEAKYRALFEQVAEPILVLQPGTHQIAEANLQASAVLGYSVEELRSLALHSLFPKADAVELTRALECPSGIVSLRVMRSDGRQIPVELSCSCEVHTPAGALVLIAFRDVSERLRNEQRLMEAQRLAKIGDWELRYQGEHVEDARVTTSAEISRILEVPEHGIGPTILLDLAHPEDRDMLERAWRHSLQAQAVSLGTSFRIHAGRAWKWVQLTMENSYGSDGQALSSRGTLQDITPIKETELALQRLNAELEERVRQRTAEVREFYDRAPCGYHSLDAEGRVERMNQTHLAWLGLSEEEVLGRPFREFLVRESVDDFEATFSAMVATGFLKDFELELRGPAGQPMPILLNARAVYDDKNNFVRSHGSCFDVSDLKKARTHLQEFVENASDLVQSLDRSGRFLYVNPAWTRVIGYTMEEALGLSYTEVVHPDDRERFHAIRMEMFNTGRPAKFEVRFVSRHGRCIELEGDLHVAYEDGRPVGTRGIFRDITARKEAGRLKDEFLASMSHELRTPLTGILGMAEALEEGTYGPIGEEQTAAVKTIYNSGRHLLSLINDILDLSKVEAGQLELSKQRCSAADICQASLHLVQGMAKKKNQSVSVSMNPASFEIDADPVRFKQVLVNLLGNAVKFTPEGGKLGLEVELDEENHLASFTVWDEGIGIEEGQLPRLFKPFTQLDSSLARHHSGTGLGLALVRRLVDLHGGSIELTTRPGWGSRFLVSLPWQPEPQSEPAPTSDPSFRPCAKGAGELVLLAEDNETNRLLISDFIKAHGYRVLSALDGGEAVALAEAQEPDLIVMDIQMPRMDGLEAIRRIRAMPGPVAKVPILALTALAMPGDRELCLKAGASLYRAKPVNLRQLAADLRTLLEARSP